MSKIQNAAIEAKAQGYSYMASVVKSVYNTTYYHVLPIDYVIQHGWEAAPQNTYGWHGRIGTSHVPAGTVYRDGSQLTAINGEATKCAA